MIIKVGDKAEVVKDDRAEYNDAYAKYVGKIGTVTYVDQELVSLKFDDDYNYIPLAYWHSEVKKVTVRR